MDLGEFINLNIFPTGRRIFAHRQILERADKKTMKDVVAHASAAIESDRRVLNMEQSVKATPQSRFGTEAKKRDARLDRSITGLDAFLESFVRIYGEDHPIGAAAARVRKNFFPSTVGDITMLPYVQEDEAVAALLHRADEDDVRALLARLPGVDALLQQVAGHHRAYHEALARDTEGPTAEDVREGQLAGQQGLYGTITLIMAHFVRTGDAATADHLLEPIRRQLQDIRDARRRRRAPVDVNPDTGEETGDDSAALVTEPPDSEPS